MDAIQHRKEGCGVRKLNTRVVRYGRHKRTVNRESSSLLLTRGQRGRVGGAEYRKNELSTLMKGFCSVFLATNRYYVDSSIITTVLTPIS